VDVVAKLFVILLVCSSCGGSSGPPSGYAVEVQDSDGSNSATVQVEIARTPAERQKGLMDRQSMPADAGMLFIFERPSNGPFWMKNTYIPLDIAFLDADGTVLNIRQGVPLSEERLFPGVIYWHVLEVNQGWFASHGLGVGDRVLIPAELVDSDDAARSPPVASAANWPDAKEPRTPGALSFGVI